MSPNAKEEGGQAPPPAQYPPYAPQVYYPPGIEAMLTKKTIFGLVAFGGFLMWLGLLIHVLGATDRDVLRFANFLTLTGAFIGFGFAAAGALGSKRTTDLQNLGLLVLASCFIVAAVWLFVKFV